MLYYVIGLIAFAYANLNLFASRLGWDALLKPRERLRERHGQARGDAVFTFTYVALPLIVAAVALWRAMYAS